ncbi:hypothetical protein CDL15_Pgr010346 [Punica granatum]|nr:hypothetical protein CDL15_Pgr010346 [Punica granatum]
MKLLTSPSFSPSATSISFQSNVGNTKPATIRCLARFLRRMLCTRSLPTHPFDHVMEKPDNSADVGTDCPPPDCVDKDPSPGIVARLMGLESLPEMNPVKAPALLSRSRSMSSVDYCWVEECDREGNQHRRVKTSQSFRETQAYLELEDGEFFVLSFEGGSESKELWSKQRRFKKGKTDRRKTDEKSPAERDNAGNRCCSRPGNATDLSEEADRVNIVGTTKPRRKHKGCGRSDLRIKKMEAEECSSEDASPVSVLDFGEWITDPEEATTASGLENAERSAPRDDGDLMNHPERPANEESSPGLGSWKKDFHPEMWSEVSKTAEEQLMESNWVNRRTQEQRQDTEAVVVDLGLQVLDQLLDELLDQLVAMV